jgi:exoribonuclease II
VDVYRALLKARHKRGALEFDAAEAEFDIDSAGRIQRVFLYERNEAHKLIEECMILANVAVARELEKRGVGTLYRVHVIVTSVNPIEGLVDLALVEVEQGVERKPQKSPHRTGKPQRRKNGREK